MALRMKVIYADGRVEEIIASPKAQVQTERQYAGMNDESRAVEVSYYLAWKSLHLAGKDSSDFESWLEAIADVEEIKAKPPTPTPEAQSSTTSSD